MGNQCCPGSSPKQRDTLPGKNEVQNVLNSQVAISPDQLNLAISAGSPVRPLPAPPAVRGKCQRPVL